MSEREVTYFQINENGEKLPVEQWRVDGIQAFQAAANERLQNEVSMDIPPGVPMEEIQQYFADMDKHTSPLVLFDSRDPQTQAVLKEVAHPTALSFSKVPNLTGRYEGTTDTTFVAIDRCSQYNPAEVEKHITRTIVHEYGHSSAKVGILVTPEGKGQHIRFASGGYATETVDVEGRQVIVGYPLNEAHAGLYESHFTPSSGSLGFGNTYGDITEVLGVPLPNSILQPISHDSSVWTGSNFPTVGVELLAIHDPQLIELVMDGGTTTAKEQELREHLAALEGEYPGVTNILLGPSIYTAEHLVAAGQAIVRYFPNARDLVIDAHEQARELIQRKIEANRRAAQQVSQEKSRESITIRTSRDSGDIARTQQELDAIVGALTVDGSSCKSLLERAHNLCKEGKAILVSGAGDATNESYKNALKAFDDSLGRLAEMCFELGVASESIKEFQQEL